ncbi:MAG: drug/metabolite transporter (DMT)-like permease [Candidatus Azotimanducaceae bacterium]|jgi:drug/metabolite transporter (DMT)-like permease
MTNARITNAVPVLSQRQDHPLLGIATFIGSMILMALTTASVKALSNNYPLGEILMFRFLSAALFFWVLLLSTTGLSGLSTSRPLGHAIRTVSGIASLSLMFFAVSTIPIADATALSYSAPIFITLLSVFLLKETIGLRRWFAIFVGFVGVLLIAQPGGSGWSIGVAAGIASAITGALVAIWLRRLSQTEKSVTIGLYYNSAGAMVYIIWVLTIGGVLPRGEDLLLFGVFGVICAAQQWLLTISFRYAEASLLAPFEYMAMIFAAIVGYLFWGEIPVLTTWIGAAVIASSGLFIFVRKQTQQSDAKAVTTD